MNHVAYMIMRRLRQPLILLIVTYAVSMLGFVLIPGVDDQGHPYRMDFFHAFYFVSFMGTTIGFGEIPYAFTPAQRAWAMMTLYGTVVAWIYSIGKVLALLQDPSLVRLMGRQWFARDVRRIAEPFYLVCGYGATGGPLVELLAQSGMRVVVVDIDQQRIDALETDGIEMFVPSLCGDASDPEVLADAGLENPSCVAVLALTNDDQVNLSIAIASKLLKPERGVVSRSSKQSTSDNLASFGTDHIVDPFEIFAEQLTQALHAPSQYFLQQWLSYPSKQAFHNLAHLLEHMEQASRQLSHAHPEKREHWVLCGYGRFGRAIYRRFTALGLACKVIEPNLAETKAPLGAIQGFGTDAEALLEAQVDRATGLVAGADNDANNLSIIMTARELNDSLVTVGRQNHRSNRLLFQAAAVDVTMEPGQLMAKRIFTQLHLPLLAAFIEQMHKRSEMWSKALLVQLHSICGDEVTHCWSLPVTPTASPALVEHLHDQGPVLLKDILRDSRSLQPLRCLPLILRRGEYLLMEPELMQCELHLGDEILLCGVVEAQHQLSWNSQNVDVLEYVLTGETRPTGYLWRWWQRHKSARQESH